MNILPPLSDAQRQLVNHFRTRGGERTYAVARRQRWDELVPIIDELTGKLLLAQRDAVAYQYLATALHLSATGQLTEEQLAASPLSTAERADCLNLLRIYKLSLFGQQAEELLKRAYARGFYHSAEGYNGEVKLPADLEKDLHWQAVRDGEVAHVLLKELIIEVEKVIELEGKESEANG